MPIREGGVTHFVTVAPEWSPTRWKGKKRFEARIQHQPVYVHDEMKGTLLLQAERQDFEVVAGTRETSSGEEVIWLRRREAQEEGAA